MASKPFSSGHDLTAADVNDLVGVYDRSTSAVDVVNTAVATSLWSKAIAANALSTDRMLRVTILGDYLNNTGISQALTLGIDFPTGTVVFSDTFTAIATAATRRPFALRFELANLNSAAVQVMGGIASLGSSAAGAFGGIGDYYATAMAGTFNADVQQPAIIGGSGIVDTTSARTLYVAVQHGAADANLSIRKKYALLELL